jgi:hypothetical protein
MKTATSGKVAFIDEAHASPGRKVWKQMWQWWRWFLQFGGKLSRREPRRLRLGETLQLGDRRFLAVVEFERARFLIGGTTASLVLLARLEADLEAEGAVAPFSNAAAGHATTGNGLGANPPAANSHADSRADAQPDCPSDAREERC